MQRVIRLTCICWGVLLLLTLLLHAVVHDSRPLDAVIVIHQKRYSDVSGYLDGLRLLIPDKDIQFTFAPRAKDIRFVGYTGYTLIVEMGSGEKNGSDEVSRLMRATLRQQNFEPITGPIVAGTAQLVDGGEWITYVTFAEDGHRELNLIRTDGSEMRNLTQRFGNINVDFWPHIWSPHDNAIYFGAVSPEGQQDVYRVSVDGLTLQNLTESVPVDVFLERGVGDWETLLVCVDSPEAPIQILYAGSFHPLDVESCDYPDYVQIVPQPNMVVVQTNDYLAGFALPDWTEIWRYSHNEYTMMAFNPSSNWMQVQARGQQEVRVGRLYFDGHVELLPLIVDTDSSWVADGSHLIITDYQSGQLTFIDMVRGTQITTRQPPRFYDHGFWGSNREWFYFYVEEPWGIALFRMTTDGSQVEQLTEYDLNFPYAVVAWPEAKWQPTPLTLIGIALLVKGVISAGSKLRLEGRKKLTKAG